uniref:Uncharacterized protein n=1 Tax=Cacopsylla melanoneura TaxID=428564 RepID=A0A8D8YUN6_9HEMI
MKSTSGNNLHTRLTQEMYTFVGLRLLNSRHMILHSIAVVLRANNKKIWCQQLFFFTRFFCATPVAQETVIENSCQVFKNAPNFLANIIREKEITFPPICPIHLSNSDKER